MNKLTEIFGKKEEREKSISSISDPFKKSCITYIDMSAWKGNLTGRITVEGYVKFKSENTEGKQEFSASSLPELMMKIYEFCEGLSG